MADKVWHNLCDWQAGHIDGKWVVLARGGTFTHRRVETLPLHVVATCPSDLDAERIVAALRYTANSPPPERDA